MKKYLALLLTLLLLPLMSCDAFNSNDDTDDVNSLDEFYTVTVRVASSGVPLPNYAVEICFDTSDYGTMCYGNPGVTTQTMTDATGEIEIPSAFDTDVFHTVYVRRPAQGMQGAVLVHSVSNPSWSNTGNSHSLTLMVTPAP